MEDQGYHKPVLLQQAVSGLITNPDGVYIDGTLGGGGHSKVILQKLGANASLYGIDQDDEAHSEASRVIGDDPRFIPMKGNFGFIDVLTPKQIQGKVDGILLDLGVSSHQINEPERGFSFRGDGPLDMRMGNLGGLTAADILNDFEFRDLANLIRRYGEEKFSGKIAKAIIAARPLETTIDLAQVIDTVTPERFRNKTYARVFQAIRIEVNQELEMLKQVLQRSTKMLAPKGRLVVISYHSLEDRMVKLWMKAGNHEGKLEKDFYGNDIKPLQAIHSGAMKPTPDEIKENPRARSARMRIAEKLETE